MCCAAWASAEFGRPKVAGRLLLEEAEAARTANEAESWRDGRQGGALREWVVLTKVSSAMGP